jgi:uncharacterized OB-fold protein
MAASASTELDSTRPFQVVDGVARLVAGVCRACEQPMFPSRERCPACGSSEVAETLLPERGTLWTWTTQGFEPKSPPFVPDGEFEPFAVGYLEFDGFLRVEGRLTESDPERLRVGMPMRVVAVDHAGVATYAFEPVEETA